jgi:hypothetical protein
VKNPRAASSQKFHDEPVLGINAGEEGIIETAEGGKLSPTVRRAASAAADRRRNERERVENLLADIRGWAAGIQQRSIPQDEGCDEIFGGDREAGIHSTNSAVPSHALPIRDITSLTTIEVGRLLRGCPKVHDVAAVLEPVLARIVVVARIGSLNFQIACVESA